MRRAFAVWDCATTAATESTRAATNTIGLGMGVLLDAILGAASRHVNRGMTLRRLCAGADYRGHSQPNVPPVKRPYNRPSAIDLSVVLHLRMNQMDCRGRARAYPMKATVL